ncbi:unnamed protein product, partial [Candidula unifasciata]
NYIIKNMNMSADPCEDFNEFACGRFIKETNLPSDKQIITSFSALLDQNSLFRNIILEGGLPSQPNYYRKMKRFYKSCKDEAQIEAVGLEPYFNDTEFTDDWPTLNPDWNEANFDLNEVIARYMAEGVEPIFSITVSYDMNDSTTNVIKLSEGKLGMNQESFLKNRSDPSIMAYQKYLAETAIALNASQEDAEKDAKDVVDLELQLDSIMVSRTDKRNYTKQLNPVLLKDLNSISNKLDIVRALRRSFDTVNISLADNERIINLYPTYMSNISSVLAEFSNRTIQNLFGFKYALLRVAGLTQKLREIKLVYDKAATGANAEPRTDVCVSRTSEAFWKALSKQYILRKFSKTAKFY